MAELGTEGHTGSLWQNLLTGGRHAEPGLAGPVPPTSVGAASGPSGWTPWLGVPVPAPDTLTAFIHHLKVNLHLQFSLLMIFLCFWRVSGATDSLWGRCLYPDLD